MRKYWNVEEGLICLCTSELDDRDILELNSIPHNRDEGKIIKINRIAKTIIRAGKESPIPFPDKFYTKEDIYAAKWEVCRIGTVKCLGHEGH